MTDHIAVLIISQHIRWHYQRVKILKQELTFKLKQFKRKQSDIVLYFIAAAGKQGTVQGDDSGLVGEVDGQGFGVGVAPPGVKPNVSTLVSTRKVKSRGKAKERDSAKSPAQGGAGQADGQAGSDGQDRVQSPSAQSPTQRAATPPPKSEAFEEFKQERGSEIYRILNQNKGNKYLK